MLLFWYECRFSHQGGCGGTFLVVAINSAAASGFIHNWFEDRFDTFRFTHVPHLADIHQVGKAKAEAEAGILKVNFSLK